LAVGFFTNFNQTMKKKLLVIAGPTAVGKTAVSIEVARHFTTEILSADSRQCYRELCIGVARPSEEELAAVPHHFIASHSVHDALTAAWYEQYALDVSERIFQKNDMLVLTGGTGLYIKAFCEGLDAIPAVPQDLRSFLQKEYGEKGIKWLREQLDLKDPLFAAKGEMQNPQRMLRALEVATATGQSILSFRTGKKAERPFQIIHVGLDLPRQELYERINQRVDHMIRHGLTDEVQALTAFRHLNALQTVGYKELFDCFAGAFTQEEAISLIKQNTRHYAKRQLTWFRKQESYEWFRPDQVKQILHYLEEKIKTPA
jgi:tRNA dimethylallyltransferase